jgi:4-amino-4-deoxy-L-arabinose transferase-like glycosyltransferase
MTNDMKRSTLYILTAVILIGAFIRLYNIGFQALNYDELWAMNFAAPSLSFSEVFHRALTEDYTPPLFYLAAHASMLVLGVTAEAIRLPSAIAGILLIPVAYLIGRDYCDDLFGLLCAGFVSILYPLVYYSVFGRAYMMAVLFVALATWQYIRLIDGDSHAQYWFAIFSVLAIWCHLYTLIPIGLMVAWLLNDGKALRGAGIILLCCIPLVNILTSAVVGRSHAISAYGATLEQFLLVTPFDLYGYAAPLLVPIIIWVALKCRGEVVRSLSVISLVVFLFTAAMTKFTPIIPHYLIFLPVLLMVPTVIPFHALLKLREEEMFAFYLAGMVFVILNVLQVSWLLTMQRIP